MESFAESVNTNPSRFPNLKSIYYLEPISEIANDTLFRVKLQAIQEQFSKNGIELYLYSSEEDLSVILKEAIQNNSNLLADIKSSLAFYCHPFYKRQFPELCQRLEQFVQDLSSNSKTHSIGVNAKTIEHFAHTWTSHYFQNLLELSTIRILKPNQFFGKLPAIFIGASSILENQWKWILDNRDYIFIFSSDTALRTLLLLGIIPDSVVSVDSGRGTHFHLMEEIPLSVNVFTWLGGSRIQIKNQENLFLFLTNHPLDQWLAQINHIPDSWIIDNPSRNIAGMCIRLAKYLGFETIFLAGFELKSQMDKTHVRGTGYESYALPLLHRKKTLASFYPRKVYGKNFSQKNSGSLQVIQNTKDINVIFLKESLPELYPLDKYSEKNQFTRSNKNQLQFQELNPPTSLYLNSIAGKEISGISNKVVKRYQSLFLTK